MNKPIIVTGANGFTGRFVCKELIRRKIKFIALLRPGTNSKWMELHKIKIRYADLNDKESLIKCFHGCRALLNIASIGFGNINVILEACKQASIKRVVFISTTAIFTKLNASSKKVREKAELAIQRSFLEEEQNSFSKDQL